MNKLKKILVAGLAVCAISCTALGIAACNGATTYPDYKRTQGTDFEFPTEGNFVVNVKSEGGQAVKGVQVSIVKDGETLTGISDQKGEVRFNAPRGSYQVIVDRATLPAGYSVMENGDGFVTGADANSATVTLSSSIITDKTPNANMLYSSGDVLYDFAFTDTEGNKYTVSELLTDYDYNTIVLNWWYVDCSWCNVEFPVMQKVYNSYSDKVAMICLSTRDTAAEVRNFREEKGYTFFMCPDSSAGRQSNYFNITAAPTTIFVDRYGVICARHEGAITEERTWQGIFDNYTSDNYSQVIENDEFGEVSNAEWTKPSAAQQNVNYGEITNTMNAVINSNEKIVGDWFAATGENDSKNAWPFALKSENNEYYVTATNSNVPVSMSIINTSVSLNAGDMLYVEYRLKNLLPNYDTFYVTIAGETTPGLDTSNDTNGWTTAKIYSAERTTTITVSFLYMSLFNSNNRNDEVSIKGFNIVNVADTDTDYPYDAATEPDANGNYTKFADVALDSKGEYHVYKTVNGERKDSGLLFTKITQRSAWSERVFGHGLITVDGDRSVIPSLYNLAYWNMSNWADYSDSNTNFRLTIDFGLGNSRNRTLTDNLVATYYIDMYIADNHLVPVTAEIKDFLEAFVNRYHEMNGTQAHENEWLELCMYYQHYGKPHDGGDSECLSFKSPLVGQNWANAIDMGEQTSIVVTMNKRRYTETYEKYLTYTATQTGIYRIYSTHDATYADLNLNLDGRGASSLDGNSLRGLASDGFNSYIYVRAGQVIGLNLVSYFEGDLTLNVQFTGQSYMGIYRTAGYGSWSATGNGYNGIRVGLNYDDGIYYQINNNGSYGSKIYIDFTQSTYFYEQNVTLYSAVSNRQFDLIDFGEDDYTNRMMYYYNLSIEGKSKTDADYGLVEATEELVNILATYIEIRTGEEALNSNYWLSMAYYQSSYGVAN